MSPYSFGINETNATKSFSSSKVQNTPQKKQIVQKTTGSDCTESYLKFDGQALTYKLSVEIICLVRPLASQIDKLGGPKT